MKPLFLVFGCSLILLSAGPSWSKSSFAYPNYEPPHIEDMPVAAPSESAPPQKEDTSNVPAPETSPEAENLTTPTPATAESEPPSSAYPEAEAPAVPAAPEAEAPVQNAPEETTVVIPDIQQEYKVKIWQEDGDSLSEIAGRLYGDPQKWRLIYLANKDVIKDPNKIYPKQKLRIPPADWNPEGMP